MSRGVAKEKQQASYALFDDHTLNYSTENWCSGMKVNVPFLSHSWSSLDSAPENSGDAFPISGSRETCYSCRGVSFDPSTVVIYSISYARRDKRNKQSSSTNLARQRNSSSSFPSANCWHVFVSLGVVVDTWKEQVISVNIRAQPIKNTLCPMTGIDVVSTISGEDRSAWFHHSNRQ